MVKTNRAIEYCKEVKKEYFSSLDFQVDFYHWNNRNLNSNHSS